MADMIDELVGMDDKALGAKLGFDDKVASFKKDLVRAGKLEGKARDKVVDALSRMFTPQTYAVDDLKWAIDRAEAKATGKTSPAAMVDCCCGDID